MKNYRILCIVLVLILLTQSVVIYADALDNYSGAASVQNGCNTLDAQEPIFGKNQILETANAAMLYEVGSDTLMYSWNADQQIYPASMVKIMTALLVLENANISDTITVTASALATLPKSATSLKLVAGEVFTVDQMMYAMMVGGVNEAAVLLAEHVSGSQAEFVRLMNQRAKELGCSGTNFVNVHGLHSDQQLSTARDLTKITAEAIKLPQFMEYFSTFSYRIAATEHSDIRRVETTNLLMNHLSEAYYDARVTGGRTGISDDSRRSVIITAESKGLHYIAVVMSAKPIFRENSTTVSRFGSFEEARDLLKLGFEQNKEYQILYEGQSLAAYTVAGGDSHVLLGPTKTVSVVLPSGVTFEDMDVRFGVSNGTLSAPVEKGTEITDVQVWYGSVCLAQSPVVALNRVNNVGHASLVENSKASIDFKNNIKTFVTVLVVIGLVLLAVYVILRSVGLWRRVKRIALHRRRRSERRRTR